MSGADWRCRPVVELDATADRCFFFWDEEMTQRACGHAPGDPDCLDVKYANNDDDAAKALQMFLFGEPNPCPDCGAHASCEHNPKDVA